MKPSKIKKIKTMKSFETQFFTTYSQSNNLNKYLPPIKMQKINKLCIFHDNEGQIIFEA